MFFFFQAEDGIRDLVRSRGLGDVYKRQVLDYEPINDDIGSDGIGPDDEDYAGPDIDGTEGNGLADWGEPDFDFTDNIEIDQVGLTSFYLRAVSYTHLTLPTSDLV